MNDYVPLTGELPQRFGRYEILGRLGRGSFATVYRARDTLLDRFVALKPSRFTVDHNPDWLQRFYQEARAAARFNHPNLCPVYEVGEIDGTHYLTMAYLDGRPLLESLPTYVGQPRAALHLVETLARALAEVHALGVAHRDLKPANIMMISRTHPVIVDFGLAQRLDTDDTRLTQAPILMGTPAYMAPEQHLGVPSTLGPACDIFSMGVILYELLAGQRPFEGNFEQLYEQKVRGELTPLGPLRAGIAPALEAICRRALAPRPEDRFPSMTEFANALAQHLNDQPEPATALETLLLSSDPTAVQGHPLSDPRVVGELLSLLRQWGWDDGMPRLQDRIRTTEDARQRGTLQLLAGWMATERGLQALGSEQFAAAGQVPELEAWALFGQAFLAYGKVAFDQALLLLDRSGARGSPEDTILRGSIAHLRGAIFYKQGRDEEALDCLYEAMERFGLDHFGTGRVLDTLGMVYQTSRDNFTTAHLFYQRSLEAKRRSEDLPGQALTWGQLGRLALDWGALDRAEECFRQDLSLCQRINDRRGVAKMYNHLGQVLLARRRPRPALDRLSESVRLNQAGGWTIAEAYALKDRARAYLELGKVAEAEADARRAEGVFLDEGFREGVCHARRALALVRSAQGRPEEGEPLLTGAAAYFDETRQLDESARTWLELAQVRQKHGASNDIVSEALQQALERAERCRRDHLLGAIEEMLERVDEAELYRRRYRRARGRGIAEDAGPLQQGSGEQATILFLDLRNYSGYAMMEDAQMVLLTLNQIHAELAEVLERYQIVVNQYLGDGFMAIVREQEHARRAVFGGLELLAALERFNRPRRLLKLNPLEARIGIYTGPVHIGNVGTYRKIDFTAVGPTTNKAARLQAEAQPGALCIGQDAYERVKADIEVRDVNGRKVPLKGMGEERVWDVVGRSKH